MINIQHLLPPGHAAIIPNPNDQLLKIMQYLVNENKMSRGWVLIPDTEIEIFFKLTEQIPVLAFRKHKKEVYVHILGLESYNLANPFALVRALYAKLKLGIPEKPDRPNWIHTIPLAGPALSAEEVMLIHQITKSFFGTLYMDYKTNVLKK
jgi:hypothetical protein